MADQHTGAVALDWALDGHEGQFCGLGLKIDRGRVVILGEAPWADDLVLEALSRGMPVRRTREHSDRRGIPQRFGTYFGFGFATGRGPLGDDLPEEAEYGSGAGLAGGGSDWESLYEDSYNAGLQAQAHEEWHAEGRPGYGFGESNGLGDDRPGVIVHGSGSASGNGWMLSDNGGNGCGEATGNDPDYAAGPVLHADLIQLRLVLRDA